ncbi:MAG: hypothetical protein O6909_13780, partial [Alphaproteobacteria bacterium]|nr:hypothetical protein [Alphaproteobacteria bacterium]
MTLLAIGIGVFHGARQETPAERPVASVTIGEPSRQLPPPPQTPPPRTVKPLSLDPGARVP